MRRVEPGATPPRRPVSRVRTGGASVLRTAAGHLAEAGRWVLSLLARSSDVAMPAWIGALRERVELRLPRFAMGLAMLLLIGLLVVSFRVGQHIGGRTGGAIAEAPAQAEVDSTRPAEQDATIVSMRRDQDYVPESGFGGAVDLPTTDPRAPGLNYLVLVTVKAEDIDEARRIQEFFRQRGVATILARTNNGRFIQVVDVSRGFTRQEYRNGEYVQHRESRRAIGRAWKRHNNGLGDDLSTMTFYKFSG